MAEHARFASDTGMPVYFRDPRSPCRRASNDNANGLLRQYLPRTADLRRFSQAALDAIAAELNGRPRQPSAFRDPHSPGLARGATRLIGEACIGWPLTCIFGSPGRT